MSSKALGQGKRESAGKSGKRASASPIDCYEGRDERQISAPPARGLLRRSLRVLVLAILLALVVSPFVQPKFSVVDSDIWWHLKVGDWIVEHSALPHTGILSRTAADRSWIAYSWVHEVLLSRFHAWFGLVGITVYGLLLALAVAYSVFLMTRRLSGSFWIACPLAALGCFAFLLRVYPRPVFFSMILFTVALTLLLEARRTGRRQLLYWLPLVFLLWANLHIQFVYGLLAVGLFVAVSLLQELTAQLGFAPNFLLSSSLPAQTLAMILGACVLATCVGPYSYHLYSVVFGYATSAFPYAVLNEDQAMNFRAYTDFVQLLLTGFAFFALGYRKNKVDPFLLALLCMASIIGYRALRDSWFVCMTAVACIAGAFRGAKQERGETLGGKAGLAVGLALALSLYARIIGLNAPNLRLAVNSVFPVQAINFLRDHPQAGPLYNTFSWGGFIAWYMPAYPVAVDGRTDLYGDEIDFRFIKTENGDPSYSEDPYLNQARLILIPKDKPLAGVLAADSRFSLIYRDSLAVVFIRRDDSAGQ
jgi:hypothetical protein